MDVKLYIYVYHDKTFMGLLSSMIIEYLQNICNDHDDIYLRYMLLSGTWLVMITTQ